MMPDGTEPQTGRETRLLVLVVGVAIVVLLLLAQWQFPASGLTGVSPNAAPLAGLAARATFDEMSSTMTDVLSRVSPLTVVVPLEREVTVPAAAGRGESGARGSAPAAPAAPPAPEPPAAWALAIRVRPDLALVHVPAGLVPQRREDAAVTVVAHDAERSMMLIRVAPSSVVPDTLSASVRTFPSVTYVAAVEATPVGPTIQPVFVGRGDTVSDSHWSYPLVPASVGAGLSAGALVFSLNSRFVGMVVHGAEGAMVVPAPALEALVQAFEAPGGSGQ
jgi:hypothetical protein